MKDEQKTVVLYLHVCTFDSIFLESIFPLILTESSLHIHIRQYHQPFIVQLIVLINTNQIKVQSITILLVVWQSKYKEIFRHKKIFIL